MMANAVKKIFKEVGTDLPARERMPSAKAMSVAMGMPNPPTEGVSRLNA